MQLFIDIIKTIVIGIVQGITEWLPISSTGHIILFEDLMGFLSNNITQEFWEMFKVVIQFGSILAVLVLFFNKLNPLSSKKTQIQKRETWSLWAKVLIASVPAAIIGLAIDDWLDEKLRNPVLSTSIIATTLIIYGILFIFVENYNKKRTGQVKSFRDMSYKTALFIGVFQMLALIPGTSRSGATILGAILLGCSRYIAAEFSFFLAIPVMFGASLLKIIKIGALTGPQFAILLIGMIVAFIVSLFAIKFLMNFVKKHDFKVFGYYRIILGVILILLIALNLVK